MAIARPGIVVLGCPRSGTTLLRRLLDAHPQIACPGETCLLTACARFLKSEVVADGLEFGVLNGLAFAGIEPAETLHRLRDWAFGFHQDLAERAGASRWAEKTAVDVFHLEQIEQLCAGQVQYVCIVRHGLDVAVSIQEFSERSYAFLAELHEYVKQDARPLEAFARAWCDASNSLADLAERRPANALLVRYEDLVESPQDEISRIFQFLGESVPEAELASGLGTPTAPGLGDWRAYGRTQIDGASVGQWKKLPVGVRSRLARICNPTLDRLGYEPVKVRATDNQEQARRRYQFALLSGAAVQRQDDPDKAT